VEDTTVAHTATPSDVTMQPFTAIYVGGAAGGGPAGIGDVAIKQWTSAPVVVFKSVPVGTVLKVPGVFLMATGTTATSRIRLV